MRAIAVVFIVLGVKVALARALLFGHAGGWGLAADLAVVVWACAGAALLPPTLTRWCATVLDVLATALLLSTLVYARYFEAIPGLALITVARQAGAVVESIADLVRPVDLLFVADLPVLLMVVVARPAEVRSQSRRARALLATTALVASGALASATILAARLPQPIDGRRVAYEYGVVAYQVSTLLRAEPAPAPHEGVTHGPRQADVQARVDELTRRRDMGRVRGAPAPGAFAGANLILVQAEALQTGILGARAGGQPVVPNIERFAAESWYFPNTVSQIGKANTADAEFIANTSLYPALEEPTPVAYAGRSIPSLPRLLRAKGYRTFTMHTNDVTFWSRDRLYPALGFERYYDAAFFGREDVTGHGASDRVLFERALPVLREAAAEGPFYAHLVTISAHHPFTAASGRGPLSLPGPLAETLTGRYLRSQSYADAELGRFLEALRREGLMDDSVVVVYGDHFGLRPPVSSDAEAALRRDVFGHDYNRADLYTVPLIVHLPGQTRGATVTHALGQVDILPTVADLLGIDLSGQLHFGRSAFARTPTLLTKGGALDLYVDDELIYIAGLTEGEDLAFSTRTKLPVASARPAGLADAARLLAISESYARALPPLDD